MADRQNWSFRSAKVFPSVPSQAPLLTDLDLVLACLRYLLMKYLRESFGGDYILKLLPPDLTLKMQRMLLVTLQKHQNQWKEELSQEEVSGSLLPQQFPITQFNNHNLGHHFSIATERNMLSFPSTLTLQNDAFPTDTLGTLPQLKFMTSTVENKNAVPESRVARITLKLQDYNKSPPMETEVKFQLTKVTLEAVLRSMTYINDQLS